ncbi:MAG: 5-(carboxyamino)imidazole ribonucleotide synthase [Elusimicrobia bacterium]|nr:5-(carboxyamino)imidazole ribonucleotide synthase [Elusimicrobiota bacterium]
MTGVVPPGSAVGVLGSGQLGRMFALAARRLGYRVHTFSPESDTPTGQVADVEITASYDDLDAVRTFAKGVGVVTFEFENVPAACVAAAQEFAPVRPNAEALRVSQHRLREKTYLQEKGFPVAAFRHVRSVEELQAALQALGAPAVLKTVGFGYDGKGQRVIRSAEDAPAAFAALGGREAVLESFVDFACELSVVAARSANGATAHWGVVENLHANHILDLSVSPALTPGPGQAQQAVEIALEVLKALDIVGVLCVEFFLTKKGRLLINELAPRPHNSGHLTLDASVTNQFEQQLRAVCGLPLGATDFFAPAAMANLLGDAWAGGEPVWARALAFPDVKLHLYGKAEARPGRKMGHLTALARTPVEARDLVLKARRALSTAS